jgi:hypothetical protein
MRWQIVQRGSVIGTMVSFIGALLSFESSEHSDYALVVEQFLAGRGVGAPRCYPVDFILVAAAAADTDDGEVFHMVS